MALKDILPGKLGFGAAPLGNMFRDIPEAEALGTVEAAWNDGIRYFDNAPFYGAGLAEIRMGEALAGKPREDYVISTKVDRVIPVRRPLGRSAARSRPVAPQAPGCARNRTDPPW
jgi:D-threo-aldose 1-dehydrogenase